MPGLASKTSERSNPWWVEFKMRVMVRGVCVTMFEFELPSGWTAPK